MYNDTKKYIEVYKSLKSVIIDAQSEDRIREAFNQKITDICLDVDKTIAFEDKLNISTKELLEQIINRNIRVHILTGRGGKGIEDLKEELLNYFFAKNANLNNLFFAVNNGSKRFKCVNGKFEEEILIKEEDSNTFKFKRDIIIDYLIKEIVSNKYVNDTYDESFRNAVEHSGNSSIRICFKPSDVIDEKGIFRLIKNSIDSHKEIELFSSKGMYKDLQIFEISLASKLGYINFIKKELLIKDQEILRIGDQGKIGGNDFDMLNSLRGFSVNEIEDTTIGVMPVLDDNYQIIKNLEATETVLRKVLVRGQNER